MFKLEGRQQSFIHLKNVITNKTDVISHESFDILLLGNLKTELTKSYVIGSYKKYLQIPVTLWLTIYLLGKYVFEKKSRKIIFTSNNDNYVNELSIFLIEYDEPCLYILI